MEESTGNNDGPVCQFHKALGYKCGLAWCAMFGKYNYQENGVHTNMDARAVSIKNDPEATHTYRGGSYWYPTKYGTGHTGFVYTWEKKNSDKFVGLDGNYTDKVRFVQRSKSKHGVYVSDPYPQPKDKIVVKKRKKKIIPTVEVEKIPEEIALEIDSGNVTFDPWPTILLKLKIFTVLCSIGITLLMIHAGLKTNFIVDK